MTPSKQARRSRQAVSAKKKASHGGNRPRPSGSLAVAATANGGGRGRVAGRATPDTADEGLLAQTAEPARRGPLGWIRTHPLPFTTWVLSLFALGVSIYLTIAHYDSSVTLVCSDKGLVNCAKVTSSSQSMVFGVLPVAVLGLAFYVFMAAINSPLGWRLNRRDVKWLRLGSVIVGMGFVLYLIYAEVVQIGNICLWCTSVHIATFFLFALLVYEATSWTSQTARARR